MANGNGRIPEGMAGLEGRGDGKVEMVIFPDNRSKQVIQRFKQEMLFVAYDLSNAVAVGKQIIDCAVACGAHVEIKVPRRPISREKRQALIARGMHIIRSLQEQGKKPATIAVNLVDQILAEVDNL